MTARAFENTTVHITNLLKHLHTPRENMDGTAMPSAAKLEPAGKTHPCSKMRLGGRQNNMPEDFCLAST